MKRVRYTETETPSVLRSHQNWALPDSSGRVCIMLNTEKLEYALYDTVGEMVLNKGVANSLHKLKIAAKNALSTLGVEVVKEERAKKQVQQG